MRIEETKAMVSIIVPAYNAEGTIRRAIDSILEQTHENIEIFVVDDGSKDGTEEVCRKYGDRIRYIRQDNCGSGAARNTGIRNANGEYVGFLDADDWYLPEKIERSMEMFAAFPEAGAVTSAFVQKTQSGDMTTPPSGRVLDDDTEMGIIDYFLSESEGNWVVHTNTILIKKEVLDSVGNFNANLVYGEDIDLWCRIAGRFDMVYQDKALSFYDRTNETSLCSSVSVLEQGVDYLYGQHEIAKCISVEKQASYIKFRNQILLSRLMLSIYERKRDRLLACLCKLYPFPANVRIAVALFCLLLPCALWPRNIKHPRILKS